MPVRDARQQHAAADEESGRDHREDVGQGRVVHSECTGGERAAGVGAPTVGGQQHSDLIPHADKCTGPAAPRRGAADDDVGRPVETRVDGAWLAKDAPADANIM